MRNLNSDVLNTDLQAAIDDANAGDRLRVKGTCVGNFVIDKDLTLRGAAGGNAGILDGNDAGRTVYVASGVTATLRRLTITGGLARAPTRGAGIRNNGTLTIRNSTITGNTAGFGGRRRHRERSGTLTVNSSTITREHCLQGRRDPPDFRHDDDPERLDDHREHRDGCRAGASTSSGDGHPERLDDHREHGRHVRRRRVQLGGTLNVLGTSSITGNTPDDVVTKAICYP